MTIEEMQDEIDSLKSENSMLRKMQPVTLVGDSARSFALALGLSEIKSLLREWHKIKETSDLPRKSGRYNVYITTSHYPTSSYDFCDSPYDESRVDSAFYMEDQKIWYVGENYAINALSYIMDETPLNGEYISDWCELPYPPDDCEQTNE